MFCERIVHPYLQIFPVKQVATITTGATSIGWDFLFVKRRSAEK